MTDLLNVKLCQHVRSTDVELSEDLYRRLQPITTIKDLTDSINYILAQYSEDTLAMRNKLVNQPDFQSWYLVFYRNILPFMVKKRLPPCTDSKAESIYQCESKPLV